MKVVISLSGGLDSAVLLAESVRSSNLEQKRELVAVGFEYGSSHNQYEIEAARELAAHYGVPYRLVQLGEVFKHVQSGLLKGEIPEGHYQEETMRQTVVPCRNVIFASVLAAIAETEKANMIMLATHAGDHAIYPDCRPDFVTAMSYAISAATEGRVTLHCPFVRINKAAIVQAGIRLKVPFEMTRTCYKGQKTACGKCGSCQERLEAFMLCKTPDPLEYESREIMPKKV